MMFFNTLLISLPLLVVGLPATPSNPSTPTTSVSETASPSGGLPFSTSAPLTWQHPGFVVSKPQLDFVKSQLSSKSQPWTDAYNKMLGDEDKYGTYVSATRSSKARATVECGPVTNPDIGCTDERGDALAAWSNALAGYLTGNEEYTKNAIGYMNKWSKVVKSKFLGKFYLERTFLTKTPAHTNANAVLQTAWSGVSLARAGELIRHTTTGLWEAADITSFENMLRNVYLPPCKDGTVKARNWDLGTFLPIAIDVRKTKISYSLSQHSSRDCCLPRR